MKKRPAPSLAPFHQVDLLPSRAGVGMEHAVVCIATASNDLGKSQPARPSQQRDGRAGAPGISLPLFWNRARWKRTAPLVKWPGRRA